MEREIKFRVWHKPTKIMYWFDLLWGNASTYGNGFIGMLHIGKERKYKPYSEDRMPIDPDECELMQFTGLFDKKNNEIYEGDIIDHYAVFGHIIFEDGMFCLNTSANIHFPNHKQPLCYIDLKYATILGNIYENPELLSK